MKWTDLVYQNEWRKIMALRNIREIGDDILYKKAKEVKEITEKTRELIDDMLETMYEADGVGLAAPQVGVLKRIAVIDVTAEQNSPIVLVNPEIIHTEGEQRGSEGCLSVPGKAGIVTRPNVVRVRAFDESMQEFEIEGEELLARALIHEIEHLDGQLYVDKVEGELVDVGDGEEEE
jgi:peptide deformylase